MFWDGDDPPTEYFFEGSLFSPDCLVAIWYSLLICAAGCVMQVVGLIVLVAYDSWHGGILQIAGILVIGTGLIATRHSIPRVRSSYYIFAPNTFKLRIRSMNPGLRSESTVRFLRDDIESVSIFHTVQFRWFPQRRESVVKIRYLLLDGSRHEHELPLTYGDSVPIPGTQLREYLVFLDDMKRCLTPEQLPDVQGLAQTREAIQQVLNRLEGEPSAPAEIAGE